MSSMENGRTHCGFRSIRRNTLWGIEKRRCCTVTYACQARKKSGGLYDEPAQTRSPRC
jgi:hypothetical protein